MIFIHELEILWTMIDIKKVSVLAACEYGRK